MSAELVDPFAPTQPPLTVDEFEAIRDAFYHRPWEDPTRFQDGFRILLTSMASIGLYGGSREWSQQEATQAVRRVMQRVLHGEMEAEERVVPAERPYETTLSDDCEPGDLG